jgi:hypothetical protein
MGLCHGEGTVEAAGRERTTVKLLFHRGGDCE